jgi:hypothetical protein
MIESADAKLEAGFDAKSSIAIEVPVKSVLNNLFADLHESKMNLFSEVKPSHFIIRRSSHCRTWGLLGIG